MNSVKLSVCIPVYNCRDYIGEAIKSVLVQDFTDLELIVLDNQSTDGTPEVVKSFDDPRVRYIQNETNIGMLANWNKVMSLANGEYIKVLPADDFLYPGCLKAQVEALEKDTHKKIAVVCGRKQVIGQDGKKLFSRGYSKKAKRVDGFRAINHTIRAGNNPIGEPGVVMFRRSILEKSGLFDASIYYVMDLFMWLRMLRHGDLFVVPMNVCAFRISPVSESIRLISRQKADVDNMIHKVYKDRSFRVTPINYRLGLINSFLSSVAKKAIYKLVLK